MGIKIIHTADGRTFVKGTSVGAGFCYFIGILCYLAGVVIIASGSLGAIVPGIIGTIFIYGGAHYNKGVQNKKLKEAGYVPLDQNVANPIPVPVIKCSNCGNATGALNTFCPNCGAKLR